MDRKFSILEHPADLGIEARGRTVGEAFQNAASGLLSVMVDLSSVEARVRKELHIKAADKERLLVRWLSEVLYLFDGEGFIGKEFRVTLDGGTELHALIAGDWFAAGRHSTCTEVKAVTYHQLLIEENKDGARVRVYLDI